jgi:hypothetical protein
LLAFKHRGRAIQFKASTKGWAQMYLRKNPRPERSRRSSADYQQDALRQGHVAVNSILRNWIKGGRPPAGREVGGDQPAAIARTAEGYPLPAA